MKWNKCAALLPPPQPPQPHPPQSHPPQPHPTPTPPPTPPPLPISLTTGEDESSYHLATRLQQRDLLPSLWFQQHSIECDRHYQHLVNLLEKKEHEAYPDYQQQLEQRWEEYRANEKIQRRWKVLNDKMGTTIPLGDSTIPSTTATSTRSTPS